MKRMQFTPREIIILCFAFVVAGIVVVAGMSYAHRAKERKLHVLFAGPYERSQESVRGYYPGCVYDLQAYVDYRSGRSVSEDRGVLPPPAGSEPRDLDWVDGAARDQLEAMIRGKKEADAVTAATAMVRLRSPSVYREQRPSQELRISYPPDGAVFPPNLCEPSVEWDDARNTLWQVTVGLSGTSDPWTFVTADRVWWFPPKVWRAIRDQATSRDAWIQVKGVRRGTEDGSGAVQASQIVHFRISLWPVDPVIVYRLVTPPFNPRKTPDTFIRDLRFFETRPFLLGRRSYCFNCHTFSSKAGTRGKLSIQTRYMIGGNFDLPVYLGMYDIDEKRGWKVRLPFGIQMTTFMAWAPDASKLAFSANQQLVTLSPVVHETQFAGEPTSDIAIYDVPQNTAYLLPGASDPGLLEIYPRWTPDGGSIVFCSAPTGVHPAYVRYDLRIVPFNGGEGGPSEPIPGASNNGKSNYYPRFSPNGKWLSFCQSNGGSLIKSSSDLYLLPGDLQGPARRLECNVDYAADSWHSWSSNSHWQVFASKRDDGIYARLYLTQIDEEGHASPAIRLPVKDLPLSSFNIPEFLAQVPRIEERELFEALRVEKPARRVQGEKEGP